MSGTFRIDLFHHFVPDEGIAKSFADLRTLIMTTTAELTAQLNAAADQAEKSKAEVVAAVGVLTKEVADLQAQIGAGVDVPPEVVAAANRVSAATQALDDLNQDSPTP